MRKECGTKKNKFGQTNSARRLPLGRKRLHRGSCRHFISPLTNQILRSMECQKIVSVLFRSPSATRQSPGLKQTFGDSRLCALASQRVCLYRVQSQILKYPAAHLVGHCTKRISTVLNVFVNHFFGAILRKLSLGG